MNTGRNLPASAAERFKTTDNTGKATLRKVPYGTYIVQNNINNLTML